MRSNKKILCKKQKKIKINKIYNKKKVLRMLMNWKINAKSSKNK